MIVAPAVSHFQIHRQFYVEFRLGWLSLNVFGSPQDHRQPSRVVAIVPALRPLRKASLGTPRKRPDPSPFGVILFIGFLESSKTWSVPRKGGKLVEGAVSKPCTGG